MKKNNYRLFAAYESGICGFMSYWEVDGFVFVEHFAVKENLRSKGAGSRMMNALFHMLKGVKIVLETEPPGNETQRRRTIFYERLGFILNEFDYIQPPYGPTKKPLHMLLMSRPDQLTRTEFEEARKTIHREVYGLQDPLI